MKGYEAIERAKKSGAVSNIADDELNDALNLISFCYNANVDALIIQDLAILRLVKMGVEGANAPGDMNFQNPLDYFKGFLDELFQYALNKRWVLYMFVLMSQARRSDGVPKHIRELACTVNQIEQSAEIIEAGQKYGYFREGNPMALAFAFWSSVQGVMEQLAVSPELIENGDIPQTEWFIDIIRGVK